MTHRVAFLDVMDAKVRDEIRSELPPGFSIDFAETTDRREHLAMLADAEFILTSIARRCGDDPCRAAAEAAAQVGHRRR